MPFLNVDTGHHFPELNEFRDRRAGELGGKLIVRNGRGRHRQRHRRADAGRDQPQPAANPHAARGDRGIPLRLLHRRRAARRGEGPRQGALLQLPRRLRPVGSEEPAPGNLESLQRPRESRRKHARLPALSNWTEMDVWEYIQQEKLEVPTIYFSHERQLCAPRRPVAAGQRPRAAEAERGGAKTSSSASAPSATSSAPACVEVPGRHRGRHHRRNRRRARDRARLPRRRQGLAKPRWKTARRRATSNTA